MTISIVEAPASDALVELPLDEGAGTIAGDVSGNGNNGSLAGGAFFEPNTGDGSAFAVRLDGVDDYIDLGGLDVETAGFTLTTWLNANSHPGNSKDSRLISKASGAGGDEHGSYIRVAFGLPRGSYATVLLREITKSPEAEVSPGLRPPLTLR